MLDRVRRGDGDEERPGVGDPDVLGGVHDQPPRDVAGVLAALEHRREVVERRVGIGAADRLDERRDEVVVRVAGLVVDDGPACGLRPRRAARRAALPRRARSAQASSSVFSAARASPPARARLRHHARRAPRRRARPRPGGRDRRAPRARAARARRPACARGAPSSTSKYGFSVVAPIRMTGRSRRPGAARPAGPC